MSSFKKNDANVDKKEYGNDDLALQNIYLFTQEECAESLAILDRLKVAIEDLRDKDLLLIDLNYIYEFYSLCAKMRNKLKYWAYCGELQIEVSKLKMFQDLLGDVSKGKSELKK